MIVVSDTSPIKYLLLIGQIDLLPRLFQQVIIPTETILTLQLAQSAAKSLVHLAKMQPRRKTLF